MIEPYSPLVSRLYLDIGRLKEEILRLRANVERLEAEKKGLLGLIEEWKIAAQHYRGERVRLRAILDDHLTTVHDDEDDGR